MFKHIVVPLDGSPIADSALKYATALAQAYDSRITLISVVTPPQIVPGEWMAETADLHIQLQEKALQHTNAFMTQRRNELRQQGYEVEAYVATGSPVADEILTFVTNEDADTIVMSTHGRSGVQRWMFGSVAERVMRQSHVPVLVIRPPAET